MRLTPILTMLSLAAALAVGASILISSGAAAQADRCDRRFSTCQSGCAATCMADAVDCLATCRRECEAGLSECLRDQEAGSAPARPDAADRVQRYEAPAAAAPLSGGLEGRILFLTAAETEPEAAFYGYLLIGADVDAERKNAVAEAVACRLSALPDAAAAAAIERLGLFNLPATRAAGRRTVVSPKDVLEAYDFDRAARWLRAAGYAAEQSFDPRTALVFVGSTAPRARQMDSVALPGARDAENPDPVIADGGALTARFAGAWIGQVIDGLEQGRVRSRQDMQNVMEAISWIEWVQEPFASLVRAAPTEQTPPRACG